MKISMASPQLGEEEINRVASVIRSGMLAHGRVVEDFEAAYASYIGTEFAVAVNSGTAALHLALLAHDIGAGDEVITTPFSFVATANAILFTGAKPVFVDIDEQTFNIDPEKIKARITGRTKAILPVHLFGQPCIMEPILDIAREFGLVVIEDACQAHGAEYKGRKVGSFGTGCFSFYPTKNMTTGEGGMITTNNPAVAEKARMLRNHGQQERYNHVLVGFNCRMTSIGAAIGLCQLEKLDSLNKRRIVNAEELTDGIKQEKGLIPPYIGPEIRHVFHQYTVRVTGEYALSRQALRDRLAAMGIGTEIYYPVPIHLQPAYRDLNYCEHYPAAEKAAEEVLSLPIHAGVNKEDIACIIEAIKKG